MFIYLYNSTSYFTVSIPTAHLTYFGRLALFNSNTACTEFTRDGRLDELARLNRTRSSLFPPFAFLSLFFSPARLREVSRGTR